MIATKFPELPGPPDDAWNRTHLSPSERLDAVVEILAKGSLRLMAAEIEVSDGAVIVDFPSPKSAHEGGGFP
jgi:hypothetical protein